jgi:hypothetical protein
MRAKWLIGAAAALLVASQALAWEPVDRRHPRWKQTVRYFVRPVGAARGLPADWQAQVQRAALAWRGECAAPDLVLAGTTDVRPNVERDGADGISVIGWEESVWHHGKGTRAVTQARWGKQNVIVEADVLLNGVDYRWDGRRVVAGPRSSALHLQSVLLHEFGHVLGLGHSYDQSALMSHEPQRLHEGPEEDDVKGLCALYGKSSTNSSARQVSDQQRQAPAGVPTCTCQLAPAKRGLNAFLIVPVSVVFALCARSTRPRRLLRRERAHWSR